MPHFLVDDGFAFHRKTVAVGNAAIGLWTRAGAWCRQQLSDGHVPAHIARTLGTAKEARALVAVGLWVEEEDGYRFHEWEERQTTREEVLVKRAAARERMDRARARSRDVRANRANGSREQTANGTTPVRSSPSPSPSPEEHPLPDESGEGAGTPPEGFEEFWESYDKKVGRRKAEQKYRLALRKPGVTGETLLAAASSYIAGVRAKGKHPEFTKDPCTWLNGEHWTDETSNVRPIRPDDQGRILLPPLPPTSPFGPA